MFAFLASRLVVYLAMSSKIGFCCGTTSMIQKEVVVSLGFSSFFRGIIVRTDRVVDSFLEKRFRGECLFNRRDAELLIHRRSIDTCECHFEKATVPR